MPRTATATAYTYVDCAACQRDVPVPIHKSAGLVTIPHGRHDCNARLAILPDPRGVQDCVYVVPRSISFEEVHVSYDQHDGPPWRWSMEREEAA